MNIHRTTPIAALTLLSLCGAVSCSTTQSTQQSTNQSTEIAHDEQIDVREMLDEAKNQLRSGDYASATDSFEWLWINITRYRPSMHGVRSSFMAREIRKLVEVHEDARERFTSIRDDAKHRIDTGNTNNELLSDWITLSYTVLGDSDRVLAWAIDADRTPEGRAKMKRQYFRIDDLLIAKGELSVLGNAMPSGERVLARAISNFESTRALHKRMEKERESDQKMDEYIRRTHLEVSLRHFGKQIGQAHIAYLASGREREAWLVLHGALKELDEPLVHTTILQIIVDAQESRPEHPALFTLADADLIKECTGQAEHHGH